MPNRRTARLLGHSPRVVTTSRLRSFIRRDPLCSIDPGSLSAVEHTVVPVIEGINDRSLIRVEVTAWLEGEAAPRHELLDVSQGELLRLPVSR